MSGKLVIGAGTIPGTYILPGLAASFKEKFPSISFEIRIGSSAQIAAAVAANELYLGVVGAKTPSPKILYQLFTEDELILAAAASNPVPGKITMDEFCKLPFIIREQGSGTRQSTEMLLAGKNHTLDQLNICATLGSSAAVKEAIKANLGVSVISKFAIREELASGKVRKIGIEGLTMKRNFYIATSLRRTLPAHYGRFIKTLLPYQMS